MTGKWDLYLQYIALRDYDFEIFLCWTGKHIMWTCIYCVMIFYGIALWVINILIIWSTNGYICGAEEEGVYAWRANRKWTPWMPTADWWCHHWSMQGTWCEALGVAAMQVTFMGAWWIRKWDGCHKKYSFVFILFCQL